MDKPLAGTNQPIRTPDQRLRVFVSSTLKELAAERSAARQAIARLRLTPVMFESGARAHPARDLYRAYLAQSHIFIGIYWQQYGFVTPGEEVSGLEDEYRLSDGMPRLIYVKTPAPEREEGLKTLLARIKAEDRISYKYFSTAEELADLVENDLALMLSEQFELARRQAGTGGVEHSGPPTNLPVEVNRFVGRELQVEAVRRLLLHEENRLVSLTGPGGVGKTRLALKAAAAAQEHFTDGVFFIDLSAACDADLVLPIIAAALGDPEGAGQQIKEKLKAHLRNRNILLVLDNLEQIVSAAPLVVEILSTAPRLKVLATSRAVLHVRGEIEFPVPPLGLPGPTQRSLEAIAQSEAVQLFVDRAGNNLAFTPENAAVIAEICQRLDGLPLAIELAAARARLLPPASLLARLSDRLKLLTGGAQDLPTRQQTLRAAIAWSYNLLKPAEQMLFAWLAVFRGGCSLEAIEAIRGTDGDMDVLESTTALVEQSLLQRDLDAQGRLRFSMLETLREYALERLQESGEMAAVQERHARCYLSLAEEAIRYSVTDDAPYWLDRLDTEIENLRAALEWSLSASGMVELGARLANDLFWFWYLRGHIIEGQAWYQRFIQSNVEKNTAAYAGVLTGAGVMANWLGDQVAARRLLDESIPFLREVGDRQELAQALMNRGIIAINEGREDEARPDLEEALAAFRALGQRFFTAVCLMHLANIVMAQGQPEAARRLLAETAAIARSIGDRWLLPSAISNQGEIARFQGDYSRAGGYYDESGALFHEINARGDMARILHNQAYVALRRGDVRLADSLFRQSLDIYRQLGIQRGIAECLAGLADVNAAQGRIMPAARMLGFAQTMIVSLGMDWWPADRREIEQARANLQKTLGDDLFNVQEAAGRSQKLEDVLEGLSN